MEVIGMGSQSCRRSGIPIRLPPRNICDVNPWMCRMTPANFSDLQSREPAVARLAFEPYPRGCNCCVERMVPQKLSDTDDDCDESKPRRGSKKKKKKKGGNWCLPKRKRRTSEEREQTARQKQQLREITKQKQLAKEERVRLLRDKKQRDDFVTACCQGLMLTPCASVDSCSEHNEEKEHANFFIHADCAPKVNDCATVNPCQQARHVKKQRADFPCQCRTCKYVKHRIDSRTGCRGSITEEKTVCYCTDEEKCETDGGEPISPCKTRAFDDSPPCGEHGTLGPCNTKQSNVINCIDDCGKSAGKVLFTAALTQEMLIQLARNGIDMANCIPTNNQYLLDCQTLPCAPVVEQPCNPTSDCNNVVENSYPPASRCRVYNRDQPQSPKYSKIPDCNTIPNRKNILECTKVAEINCEPDLRCHVYNCEQPQYNRARCTMMPDCTKIYDLDSQPEVAYSQNNCQQPCLPLPQFQQNVCHERMCQKPYSSSQFNSSHRSAYQGNTRRDIGSRGGGKPCGHICIPKGAFPGCAGDMSRSKFLIPLTFHPRKGSYNSRSYPCMDSSWRPPTTQERMSSIQENLKMYSSSRKTSEPKVMPSRLLDERTSDTRNFIRSNETQATKRSSPTVSPRNSSGFYGTSAEGAIDQPPISLPRPPKDDANRRMKTQKSDKKTKNERPDNVKRRSKQGEPPKDRPRSRSPSPVTFVKSKEANKIKNLPKKVASKPPQRPSSPPHFEDAEPSPKTSMTAKNGYEAELLKAMDRVKRKYMEQNYDTTGSSTGSRATTATEPCLTPTYQEFQCLTKQIKCLRKELRKYCSAEC